MLLQDHHLDYGIVELQQNEVLDVKFQACGHA